MIKQLCLFFCLLSGVLSVRIEEDLAVQEIFMGVVNAMMNDLNLSNSVQIRNSFTAEQLQALSDILTKLTFLASQQSPSELRNFPATCKSLFQSSISEKSLKSFYLSRDFNLWVNNFNLDPENYSVVFASFVDKKYLTTHNYFETLKNYLTVSNLTLYGQTLNQLLRTIYSAKTAVENQWTKTVSHLQSYKQAYYGVSVSNGVIGAVSSIKPLSVSTTVLAGAYDVFGRGRVDNIVQTFPALQVSINYGFDVTSSRYYNYEQSLHFDRGQFEGAFSSDYCSVQYNYFALKNLPFAFYTSITLIAHSDSAISLQLRHKVPDYLNNVVKSYETIDASQKFDIIHTRATSKTGKLELVVASSFVVEDGFKYELLHEDWDSNLHYLKLKTNVTKGSIYHFGIVTCLISTRHHSDPLNEAIRVIQRALSLKQSSLLQGHYLLWKQLWEEDILIEGNDQDQKDVRLMLYHCYSFINDFKSYGISPMGLSGLGYNGHVFWDMDLWIYPAILALKPSLAKTLIQYRYQRLEAAKNNAFINGYKGAMYPWESSQEGVEETPVWALTGPLQHHISGCVSFAVWNYYSVTQDKEWLREKGYGMISAIADFWVSRVQLGDDGKYHINNVVAADQWAENVDDNAFTNAIAIKSLSIGNKARKILGYSQNPIYKKISENLVILEMEDGVTKEYRGYTGGPIKQADVNLLSFPLKSIVETNRIVKDLQFYESRIPKSGTPAMTYSIFTILYSRLLNLNKSYFYFKESYKDNLRKPFNVFAETKDGTNPYFLTGAGGVLQSLIFGFAGYDITDQGIVKISSVIPKQWKSIQIKGLQ